MELDNPAMKGLGCAAARRGRAGEKIVITEVDLYVCLNGAEAGYSQIHIYVNNAAVSLPRSAARLSPASVPAYHRINLYL